MHFYCLLFILYLSMLYNLYKPRGETPLECLSNFLRREKIKEKAAYLGRLDPMAEGVLLIATGDDIKKRDEMLTLDKEYNFTILFGFSTDSYDALGKILRVESIKDFDENYLRKAVAIYQGERDQKYPLFSSKSIGGRSLYEWARMEKLDLIEVPSQKITIHKLSFGGLQKFQAKELLGRLLADISKVKGDFRQHDTLVLWKEILQNHASDLFIGKFNAHVSAGCYIRSIVNELGNTMGTGACALSIVRTRVGEHMIENSIRQKV